MSSIIQWSGGNYITSRPMWPAAVCTAIPGQAIGMKIKIGCRIYSMVQLVMMQGKEESDEGR